MSEQNISAAVLAGGQNSRMGFRQKLRMPLAGKPMAIHITDVLKLIFREIILISNDEISDFKDMGFTCCHADVHAGKGPLAGIHAAMIFSKNPLVFVFACDLPLLDAGLICRQLALAGAQTDAVIPVHPGGCEPLHAIYKKERSGEAEKILKSSTGPSIRTFLNSIRTTYFETDLLTPFTNINTEEERLIAEKKLIKQSSS